MKDEAEFFDRILRNITDPFAKLLSKFITGNQMTIMGIILALTSCGFLFTKHYVIGGFLIFIYEICDCLDGEISRIRKQTSKFGKWLDGSFGFIIDVLFLNEFERIKQEQNKRRKEKTFL